MDETALLTQLAEYEGRRNRDTVVAAVQRELMISGGMGNAAMNIAGLLHQNQQQAMQNTYQGTAHMGQAQMMSQSLGSTGIQDDGEHVTQGILADFKAKDQSTGEFASATSQLLNARIRAAYSPNRAPRCSPIHGYIVWQLFNHNWMVDVQWVGDATGGSEEEWTSHFAKLANRISEARERGDKQCGDESDPRPLTAGMIHQAQQMLGQQAVAQSQWGQQHASLAGQQQSSSAMGAGGRSAKAHPLRRLLGMGP